MKICSHFEEKREVAYKKSIAMPINDACADSCLRVPQKSFLVLNKMAAFAFKCAILKVNSPCFLPVISVRGISTTTLLCGKRNFRKFLAYNKRGTPEHKNEKRIFPEHDLGVRHPGVAKNDSFLLIPELIPELIVPDLTDFKLKPYVSYRVKDVVQSEFTAKDLFNACYADKIVEDFKKNNLNDNGDPTAPSFEEILNTEEAFLRARKTGCDIFYEKLNIDPIYLTDNY